MKNILFIVLSSVSLSTLCMNPEQAKTTAPRSNNQPNYNTMPNSSNPQKASKEQIHSSIQMIYMQDHARALEMIKSPDQAIRSHAMTWLINNYPDYVKRMYILKEVETGKLMTQSSPFSAEGFQHIHKLYEGTFLFDDRIYKDIFSPDKSSAGRLIIGRTSLPDLSDYDSILVPVYSTQKLPW